jgi:DNA-binding NtrC family response regulator
MVPLFNELPQGPVRRPKMARILILDDVFDAVRLMARVLEENGHAVFPFTDEEPALAFIAANPVDLVILDIKLKKMSGLDVLARIKQIAPRTRTLVLTGYPTVEVARESIRLGAGEFCAKPIDNAELEEKVSRLLAAD